MIVLCRQQMVGDVEDASKIFDRNVTDVLPPPLHSSPEPSLPDIVM